MSEYALLYGIIFVFVWGVLNRFEELTNFESWWDNSIFKSLENKYPKLYKWLRSYDKGELNYLEVFGIKIKLHPIFKDGYHFSKNLIVLLFAGFVMLLYGWQLFVAVVFVWWIAQTFALSVFIKGNKNEIQ